MEQYPFPEELEKLDLTIPNEGILFDYAYNYKMKGSWKYWPEIVRAERVDDCKNILQALIPTVDTSRFEFYLQFEALQQSQLIVDT